MSKFLRAALLAAVGCAIGIVGAPRALQAIESVDEASLVAANRDPSKPIPWRVRASHSTTAERIRRS